MILSFRDCATPADAEETLRAWLEQIIHDQIRDLETRLLTSEQPIDVDEIDAAVAHARACVPQTLDDAIQSFRACLTSR